MIAYFALGLSIFNTLLWVALAVGIRKVFKRMMPLFMSMGLTTTNYSTQNLTPPAISDKL